RAPAWARLSLWEPQPVSTDLVLTAAAGSAVPASSESRPSTAPGAASRQGATRRQRGFQTLTLQAPENLDASHDGSPAIVGATSAVGPDGTSGSDSRSTDTLLIQGSVSSDS